MTYYIPPFYERNRLFVNTFHPSRRGYRVYKDCATKHRFSRYQDLPFGDRCNHADELCSLFLVGERFVRYKMYDYSKKNMTPNELYHWGILGQKWGVRRYQNKDGTLTPAGRARYGYKEINEKIKQSKYDEDISDEIFTKSGADKAKLKQAKDEVQKYKDVEEEITNEMNTMFKGMTSDNNTRKFYEAVSETASFINEGYYDKNNFTMKDLAWSTYMGTYEDGQQSRINAYSMYADEKGYQEKIAEMVSKESEAYNNRLKAAKDLVNESLKEIGMEEINSVNISSRLVNQIENSMDNWNKHGGAYILKASAEEVNTFEKGTRDDIKKAKEWCSKIDNNESSWWYLNEAVEDLGLDNKKCDDMTQADWDKINKYIREKIRTNGRFG